MGTRRGRRSSVARSGSVRSCVPSATTWPARNAAPCSEGKAKVASLTSHWGRFSFRAGRSSEVERSLMVRWVVLSILHRVDPLSYFSFQSVLQGCGMCYPVCGMVHIKEPLLLIGKSSLCGGSGLPLSLSEWSFTICPMPYNRK